MKVLVITPYSDDDINDEELTIVKRTKTGDEVNVCVVIKGRMQFAKGN